MDSWKNEQLIAAVRKRRALWDVTDSKYYNKITRAHYWEDLCVSLIPEFRRFSSKGRLRTVFEVQRRWRYIRDAFTRSLRARQNKPGGDKIRPYIYEKQLAFLNMCRKMACFNEPSLSPADDDTIDNELENKYDNELVENDDALPTIDNDDESPNVRTSHSPHSLAEATTEEENDDVVFFRTLLPLVEHLPLRQKMKFRIEMTKMALDSSENTIESEPNETTVPLHGPSISSGTSAVLRDSPVPTKLHEPCIERPKLEIDDLDYDASSGDLS
ncbi:uncharacterized protein LOC131425242 [Malaya genurostris]|uniref:uncharacterized protein LOC131425242 n=1 Tax=Malaya genurostris TaxID=325434 RepID=UPI0026F37EEC|nr:uncharacterized protein LOC131425242 [Malaya genurostris]